MKFLLLLIFILKFVYEIGFVSTVNDDGNTLMGAIYAQRPYLMFGDDAGFVIDLLAAISVKVGFKYSLYNGINCDNMGYDCLIQEIDLKRADFAVGNLDDTARYRQYVDFTDTIIDDNHLSALVSRSVAMENSLCTVADLFKDGINKKIKIGSAEGFRKLMIINEFYQKTPKQYQIIKNVTVAILREVNLFSNYESALKWVKQGSSALIFKLKTAEYLAGQDCKLTVLREDSGQHFRKMAFTLPKGSKYLSKFNAAINSLKEDGTFAKIYNKYWKNNCVKPIHYCNN